MDSLIDYFSSKAMPHKACKEFITNNHKQKGDSEMRKGLLTLALVLTAMLQTAWAYDFSATSPSGHTLYYEIISGTTNVGVVRPGTGENYNNYVSGNVVIPDTVAYNGTTYNVTELRPILDSSSYSYYGSFESCSGLISVTIPNSVTTIGTFAFAYCSGLTSVTIPNSVTTIGDWAFYGCSGLTSITIPNSVTTIGDYAFLNCRGLTSVTIPNSVTTIGNNAFGFVKNIIYNGTATGSPWGALSSQNNFVEDGFVYFDNTKTTLLAYIGSDTNVIIPNSVTTIGYGAFYGCVDLTSVTIPNSVDAIHDCTFQYCTGLTSVTIPNSVTYIGDIDTAYYITEHDGAFYGCTALTSITIPNSVTYIGDYTFYGCTGLTSVTLPDYIDYIDYIGGYGNYYIGSYAFYGCSGLTSVTIPDYIGDYYINYSIGNYAFQGCTGLTSVTIPNSVTTIGYGAFYGCSGLTSVTIPNSVTVIGEYAFSGCSGLTSVTIPNSVIVIDGYAFSGCSGLTSVTIGKRARSIIEGAFYGCNNLYEVVSLRDSPSYGNIDSGQIFSDTVVIPILKVPCGSADAYRSSDRWSQYFVEIEEICDNLTITVTSSNESMGTVSGSGEYEFGTDATITATPNDGYRFVSWNDGNTDNPRAIIVTEDATYIANFEESVGIESRDILSELTFYPNPTSGNITFNRNDIIKVEVLDAMGRMVAVYENAYTIDISKLAKGYYAMRITTAEGVTVRKVVRN